MARHGRTALGVLVGVAVTVVVVVASTACAGTREHLALTPGLQTGEEAVVDVQTGSVTQEQEGVVLRVQGVMLPAPRSETPKIVEVVEGSGGVR